MPLSPIERMIDAACGYEAPAVPDPTEDARFLTGATNMGREISFHVLDSFQLMYPEVWRTLPRGARQHLKQTIVLEVSRIVRQAGGDPRRYAERYR